MKNMRYLVFPLVILLVNCSSIQKSVKQLELKHQYNAGFYVVNQATNKVLIDYRSNHYFTPASNTKVYTLYAANAVLPDSIPAFKYIQSDSALFIWGLADPSFLNPLLPQGKTYSFLANQPKIYMSHTNYDSPRFGAGWAWDDYNGGYSQEQTGFPIYGNSVSFNVDSTTNKLLVQPSIFYDSIIITQGDKYTVQRQEFTNQFEVNLADCDDCQRLRPLYFTDETFKKLLQDTLHTSVEITEDGLPAKTQTYYSIPKDSVLRVMMQQSDNFMAEHLLLSVAGALTDTLSTKIAIREMSKKIELFVPDKLVWRDGSGLSRYNLVTPRNMVALWAKLYKEMGEDRLFSLISAGGERGTLAHWFAAKPPYIYGKTGTLSNVFALSGFLVAKSGKRLIFSYTNNNYSVSSAVIKKEMDLILREVYEKY